MTVHVVRSERKSPTLFLPPRSRRPGCLITLLLVVVSVLVGLFGPRLLGSHLNWSVEVFRETKAFVQVGPLLLIGIGSLFLTMMWQLSFARWRAKLPGDLAGAITAYAGVSPRAKTRSSLGVMCRVKLEDGWYVVVTPREKPSAVIRLGTGEEAEHLIDSLPFDHGWSMRMQLLEGRPRMIPELILLFTAGLVVIEEQAASLATSLLVLLLILPVCAMALGLRSLEQHEVFEVPGGEETKTFARGVGSRWETVRRGEKKQSILIYATPLAPDAKAQWLERRLPAGALAPETQVELLFRIMETIEALNRGQGGHYREATAKEGVDGASR